MKWFELAFSNKRILRRTRHAIFWIAWWLYFAGSYFFTQQGTEHAGSAQWISIVLVKSLLLLLCHAFIVYVSIYLLLPHAIEKKWFSFSLILIVATIVTIVWSYCCYAILFPWLDNLFHVSGMITKKILFWNSVSAGFVSSLKVVIAAVAIKLVKYWWQKQKEAEKLEQEKIAVELQLLKAQIHPDVLFSSLENIYRCAQQNPPKASELLIKLSDVLSYVLYECDGEMVPLEKELKMINDYLALEKTTRDKLELSVSIKGDPTEKTIAPLLLLPFLENGLFYCGDQHLENSWLNLDIRIDEDELYLKLVNGKSSEQVLPVAPFENGLGNVQRRLQLLYPAKNEIHFHEEPEVMMTYLKINLISAFSEKPD